MKDHVLVKTVADLYLVCSYARFAGFFIIDHDDVCGFCFNGVLKCRARFCDVFIYCVTKIDPLGTLVETVNSSLLKWLNVVAFVAVVAVNSLAGSTTLIGGQDTAAVSDRYFTLITPAGYTFAIWGIIYFLLGVFVVFQALPSDQGKTARKVGWFFILGAVLNIAWLFLWQYEHLTASVVLMFLLFASLLMIYLRLGIGKSKVPLCEKLTVHVPFSVYFGWITIAAIANVSTALVSVGWDGFGIPAETWAILVIVIALLITSLVVFTKTDFAYGLVIIWALVGISVNGSGNETVALVAQVSAAIVAVILVASVLLSVFKSRRARRKIEKLPDPLFNPYSA